MNNEVTEQDMKTAKFFWDSRFAGVWDWHELTDEHKNALARTVRDSNNLMEAIVWGLGQRLKNDSH